MAQFRDDSALDELQPFERQLVEAGYHLRDADPILAPIIERVGPCTLKLETDHFASLISAIIAQQISSKAASSIEARFHGLFGDERPFSPANVAALTTAELRAVGLSEQKASYIHDLAQRIVDGSLALEELPELDDEVVISQLLPAKGIGRWTAEMFLIFSLGRLDVLPVDDLGLRTAVQRHYGLSHLPKTPDLVDLGEPWRPFRTVATWYLWKSIGGMAGEKAGGNTT